MTFKRRDFYRGIAFPDMVLILACSLTKTVGCQRRFGASVGGKYKKPLWLKNKNPNNLKVIFFKQAGIKTFIVTKYEKIEFFYLA